MIINIPQPIQIDQFDDTPFYDMVSQHENLHISDEMASVILEHAEKFVTLKADDVHYVGSNEPMTDETVMEYCRKHIVKQLIYKFQ